MIERQATACQTIVQNLGTYARVAPPGEGGLDVNAELRKLLAMVRGTLLTEKIGCHEELDDTLPPARGDAQGFHQVVLNLITNARAAMKGGGVLRVRTGQAGGSVEIQVRDTGHGIPRADLEHIFDPFFTTKPPGEGTGLGLSISHGIVEKAGGRITVESHHVAEVGPNRCGTVFRIFLPVAGEAERAGAPAGARHVNGGSR